MRTASLIKSTLPICLLLICLGLAAGEAPFIHLDFDKVDNGTIPDKSGNRNDGRMSNAALQSDGVDSYGVRFSGHAAYVNAELDGKWRKLSTVTVSCWIAPEEIKHQVVAHSAPMKDSVDDASFSLRLRENWDVWFGITASDGERRGVTIGKPGFDHISYPERRNWIFLAGTYDGENVTLYVNGERAGTRKFNGIKAIKPISAPVRIGGDGNETYHGAVDEYQMYDRALAPGEIKARYEARSSFKSQFPPPKNAGTIDGRPYSGCSRYNSWMTVPLASNRLFVSNTGEVLPFGCSPVCAQNQWIPIAPLAIMSQSHSSDRFYRKVKGNIELRSDDSTLITLEGETKDNIAVRQKIEVGKDKEVRFSYSFSAMKPDAAEPFINFPVHLWPSAMRFVGSDERGPITGNLMDLDGTLLFRDVLEINLISSDNRLSFDFGKSANYQLTGTRDPRVWANGYTTFPGRITAAKSADKWRTEGKMDIYFTMRLEQDSLPPRLDRSKAKEVTADKRFDFSKLYEKDFTRLGIAPADRDEPIYMDNEPIALVLTVPEKSVPASKRDRKWFHLAGTYDGYTCRLYMNGKEVASQSFPDKKSIILQGAGTVCVGGPQEPFRGAIDNVRLYRRALSSEELKAHFDERKDFKPGAQPDYAGGKLKPADPELALWLDFNKIEDGFFIDRSSAGLKAVRSAKATQCDGVDGAAVHLSGGESVKADLPEASREFKALTVEAWVSPDDPQHSTVVSGVHHENKYNAHPFMLRWRQGNEFWLQVNTADGQNRSCMGEPAAATLKFPEQYKWTLTNCFTKEIVKSGDFAKNGQTGDFERKLSLPPMKAAVYELKVDALDAGGKVLDHCATELAVAGEISQSKAKANQKPELKKVDEVDFTKGDPGHDFYSRSGNSKVVKGEKGSYRQTLSYQDFYQQLDKEGAASRHAGDWFGVRFRTEPGKAYVFEIEYPDLPYMSMSEYLIEPKDDPADGKCKPVLKTASGVFTGSFLPHDNSMKTQSLAHFASAPWVSVCFQNAHYYGRPDTTTVLDPASCRRITMYEVVGDLPALDAPAGRQLGVHTEDGGLSLGSFGIEKFRGELANWKDRPKMEEYYRHAYIAVSNLIKYMRYRGDTTLFYGIYRYRGAQFPSRLFPPDNYEVDLPALMARMFEKNGLKLVLNVQANNPLPESRLHEFTHYDIWNGADGVSNVNAKGRQNAGGSAIFPISNPWH
ncbi:MAG: LamG domain-containing protein, partial [Victivallales bacterium]